MRLALTFLIASTCFGAGTRILDTITNPDHVAVTNVSLFNGTLTITGPFLTTAAGGVTYSGVYKKDFPIVSGALDVTLVPNDALSPAGTSYGVTYLSRNGVRRFEYWIVPTSGSPLKIPDVKVSSVPTPNLSVSVVQLDASTCAKGGILASDASHFGCLGAGTDGYALVADSTQPRGLRFSAISGGIGTPGGSSNSIQYNSASTFGGILNTTGTRKFVTQISSGAPTFDVLQSGDIPALNYQPTLGFTPLNAASNLSDLASASTARTNLGLGTAATSAASAFAAASHTHAASDVTSGIFDIARLATGTPTGAKFVRDDGTLAVPTGTGIGLADLSATTPVQYNNSTGVISFAFTPANVANNLSDLASASTARTNLGLGTAAVAAASSFEVPLTFTAPLVRTVNAIACATCIKSSASATADAMLAGAGGQSVVATNCTKATGQPLTCPDGFNSGGGTGPYFSDISGDTNGYIRLKATATSVTGWTATFPAASGTVMYINTAVDATQLPALTGDVTSSAGSTATTVTKINGVSLAGLSTGLLKNTTGTGAPSIAAAADLPAHASRHQAGGTDEVTVSKLNGVSLGGLATGPLCNTTTTGTPYACAGSDLPAHASRHQNGGNDEVATATPGANVIPKSGADSRLAPGWLQYFGGGGQIPLSGLNYIRAYSGLVTNGTNDIYTAPTLKRAYIQTFQAFNTTGGSIVASVSLKSGGNYYRLTSNQTLTTLTNTALVVGMVLEPGESIAAVSDVTGLNVYFRIMEYDSSVPMYSPRLLSVASGDNTLYTVPAGKSAMILASSTAPNGIGVVLCSNATGGTRTVKYYVVSSGNVNGSAFQVSTATVLNNTAASTQVFGSMATGDFIVYNTDAATTTQAVWTVVVEK